MKYEIKNRWTQQVQFTAEIDCDEGASVRIKLGLAIKVALKGGADLRGAYLRGALLAAEKREGKWALPPASQVAVAAYEAGQADAEEYRDRIEQLEADVERHINTAAELRLSLDSVLEYYVNMINSKGHEA